MMMFQRGKVLNMNKTKIRATEQPIAVDIEGLSAALSCGRATARKIGEQAGAKIVDRSQGLYSIEKSRNTFCYIGKNRAIFYLCLLACSIIIRKDKKCTL